MLKDTVGRVIDRLEDFLASLAGVILLLIIVCVSLEIVMRYFFKEPLFWVVELSEYGLLYITFLAAPWLLRQGGHVQVDVVINHLPPGWRKVCAIFSSTVCFVISLLLTVFGARTTYDYFLRKLYKPTVLEFPTWIVLLVIPVGSLFLAIRFFRMALDRAGTLRDDGIDIKTGDAL